MAIEVRLERLNWDEECRKDFLIQKGFRITQDAFDKKQNKNRKNMHGIHSPIFATD